MPATARSHFMPPTARQVEFFNEVVSDITGEAFTTGFGDKRFSRAEASNAIDAALKLRRQQRPTNRTPRVVTPDLPNCPDGRYAIRSRDGQTVRFFKLDTGTGRWEGRRFLSEQHSDDFIPVRDKDFRAKIIAFIAKDVWAALTLYGKELGVCGECGRALTQDHTRLTGIGDDCRFKKTGRKLTAQEKRDIVAGVADSPEAGQTVEVAPPAPVVVDDNAAEARMAQAELQSDRMDSQRGAASGILAESAPALLAKLDNMLAQGAAVSHMIDGLGEDEAVESHIKSIAIDYIRAAAFFRRSAGAPTIGRSAYGF